MRSKTLAFCLALVSVWTSDRVHAATPGGLQERATREFRAKHYAVACALFAEFVGQQKFDAWAWNDLALCRVKQGDLAHVTEALEKASALEKAVGDPKLASAIATNEDLLVKALLAARTWPAGAGLPAANLAIRRFDAEEKTSACPLFEHALATGEAVFAPDEWRRIAQCRLDTNQPDLAVLDAAEHASGVPEQSWVVAALAARAVPEGDTWQARCRHLEGGACGRDWLLCAGIPTNVDESYSHSTTTTFVVIEAKTLAKWKRSPFEVEGAPVFQSSEVRVEMRCAGPKGQEWLSPVGNGLTLDQVVTVDACAGVVVRWKLEDQCESDGGAFSREAVSPVPLPQK
jgi:hypothetical protein